MREEECTLQVRDHLAEISRKLIELDGFDDADIALVKKKLQQGIESRKRLAVVPMEEIRNMMIGLIAIRLLEEKSGMIF